MKKPILAVSTLVFLLISLSSYAQLAVIPLAPQKKMLESNDPKLAKNKKLVYDMWREFLEGGHMEVAEKYFAENYMQHNPTAATGRQAVVERFSRFTTPQTVLDTIKARVVSITAEGDLVTLSFVRELPEKDNATKKYTTTWFDMFRIENGKLAEHWDSAMK